MKILDLSNDKVLNHFINYIFSNNKNALFDGVCIYWLSVNPVCDDEKQYIMKKFIKDYVEDYIE